MNLFHALGNICLVVETGLRYPALKNVSLDISFKYR